PTLSSTVWCTPPTVLHWMDHQCAIPKPSAPKQRQLPRRSPQHSTSNRPREQRNDQCGLSRPTPWVNRTPPTRAAAFDPCGGSLRAARGPLLLTTGTGLSTLAASRPKSPARCGKLDTHAVP